MPLTDPFEVSLRVIRVLEALSVDYLIVGSVASSFHGTPRSTHDVDLVADLKPAHALPFVAQLENEFYVEIDSVRRAIRRRSSFNLIDLHTMFKVDVFVLKADPHSREEMRRRQRVEVGADVRATIEIATAEDTVLQKLVWFRLGGGSSERQWDDLLGVLRVQGRELDQSYLERWAEELDLVAELAAAFDDAGR